MCRPLQHQLRPWHLLPSLLSKAPSTHQPAHWHSSCCTRLHQTLAEPMHRQAGPLLQCQALTLLACSACFTVPWLPILICTRGLGAHSQSENASIAGLAAAQPAAHGACAHRTLDHWAGCSGCAHCLRWQAKVSSAQLRCCLCVWPFSGWTGVQRADVLSAPCLVCVRAGTILLQWHSHSPMYYATKIGQGRSIPGHA